MHLVERRYEKGVHLKLLQLVLFLASSWFQYLNAFDFWFKERVSKLSLHLFHSENLPVCHLFTFFWKLSLILGKGNLWLMANVIQIFGKPLTISVGYFLLHILKNNYLMLYIYIHINIIQYLFISIHCYDCFNLYHYVF